jgi:hypothetical protein
LITSENEIKNELIQEIIDFLVVSCEINEDDFLYTTGFYFLTYFSESITSTSLYSQNEDICYPGIFFSHKYLQGTIYTAINSLNPEKDLKFINLLINELLQSSRKKFPKTLSELPGSYGHRHLIRIWRVLILLVQYVTEEIALKYNDLVWICFEEMLLNSIRRLIEIFYSNLVIKFPVLIKTIKK